MISTEAASGRNDRDEVNVVAMVQVAWRYRYFIAAVAVVVVIAAVIVALTTTPVFRAQAVVTEARDEAMGAGSSLASQLGGLASIAGINISAAGGPGPEAQAVLRSRGLSEEFVKRYKLVEQLMPNAPEHATLWFAVDKFRNAILKITTEPESQTTTIQIDWHDPAVASQWANAYVALANETLRSRALSDSSRNIQYLKEQIAKTDVVELQRVMYGLIEIEMKTLMLANARTEYAFTVVDPGVTPERRVWPRRTLMVLSGGVLGVFLGFLLALAHSIWRRHRAEQGI
ncbi:MAG TPA: Wzz/FepE/Etk N-terminal domain-containing protein [Steroidobacteraceae bacterium]|nr:Wzz/FepE/Etk N-terminal domain-containing protein [Steroidobacteraceae bacterium]